ncbi:hypothetical protein ACFLIM_39330 [Nonomuraea sp. M3C6]|uniref:Phosphotransferase enzyme family protein n=1 Tax=Nonomuraea marmarensis TaxID=3351344 RepID=A0ABW7APD1_9ACTN
MALTRVDWEDLPAATRGAIEKHTGRVRSARTVSEGLNSSVAMLLSTEVGPVFVKGLRRAYPRRWTQDMEWMVNPYVTGVAPRVLWRIEEEWDLLGFEAVEGRHAVYEPDSADLPRLMHTMAALGKMQCPDLPLKTAEDRWGPYVTEPEQASWFVGGRLLHTDYNPLNVLISGRRALLIDWAWPTKGAGWIDPACLVIRLIAGGHTAEQAERAVSGLPAWEGAPVEGLDVFSAASVRLWQEIEGAASTSWTAGMAEAACMWQTYRGVAA